MQCMQCMHVLKSGNISAIWGEALTVTIETKICVVGKLDDVITHAKFQYDIIRWYDFTGEGGRISHFLIDFCIGRTTYLVHTADLHCTKY